MMSQDIRNSICVDRSLDQGNRTRVQKGTAADSETRNSAACLVKDS